MKKIKQFENYKIYEMKEGDVVVSKFLAKNDKDARLYINKIRKVA